VGAFRVIARSPVFRATRQSREVIENVDTLIIAEKVEFLN